MNIYLMVDAEGISGIFQSEQVTKQGGRYRELQEFMTREINICAEACKSVGVDKVYVRDAHSSGDNVLWDKLSPAVDYIVSGNSGSDRFPGLEECDCVILLGYHAMAGTPNAVLEHTFNSHLVQNYWLNGVKVGEVAIDAAIVGERGKPVIMVSGDDKLCSEAAEFLPWTVTAQVKRGLSWRGALLLPPDKAKSVISEKTIEAIRSFDRMEVFKVEKPVKLRMEYIERGVLPAEKPYLKIIDGRTFEITADTVENALNWR